MFLRQSVLFVLTLSATVTVQGDDNSVRDNSLFVHEEFLPSDSVGEGNRPFLRGRELQSSCRATNPRNVYICGSLGMPDDSCQSSLETCEGMSYGCSCDGSGEFSCNYCRVQTSNAVICQVIGTSLTFPHPDEGTVTCSCDYVNGQVRERCIQAVSTPTGLPEASPEESPESNIERPTDTEITPGVGAAGASGTNVPVPAPRVAVPATVTSVRNPTLPAALFPTPMFTGNGFGSAAGGSQAPVSEPPVTETPVSEPPVTEAPVSGGVEAPVPGGTIEEPIDSSPSPGKGSVKGAGSKKGSKKGSVKETGSKKGSKKGSGKGSEKETGSKKGSKKGSGKGSEKGTGTGKASVKGPGTGKASVKGPGKGSVKETGAEKASVTGTGKGSVKETGTEKASVTGTGKGTPDRRRKH